MYIQTYMHTTNGFLFSYNSTHGYFVNLGMSMTTIIDNLIQTGKVNWVHPLMLPSRSLFITLISYFPF